MKRVRDDVALPCPWCGLAPTTALTRSPRTYSIGCTNPSCKLQPSDEREHDTIADAVLAWNTRSPKR